MPGAVDLDVNLRFPPFCGFRSPRPAPTPVPADHPRRVYACVGIAAAAEEEEKKEEEEEEEEEAAEVGGLFGGDDDDDGGW